MNLVAVRKDLDTCKKSKTIQSLQMKHSEEFERHSKSCHAKLGQISVKNQKLLVTRDKE